VVNHLHQEPIWHVGERGISAQASSPLKRRLVFKQCRWMHKVSGLALVLYALQLPDAFLKNGPVSLASFFGHSLVLHHAPKKAARDLARD
jgi:hypothetical protein